MRTRTLTLLIQDVRQRTNMENSVFVTDAEITEYLNQELAELYTRLVFSQGQPHYRSSTPYTVTSATPIQTLPADFWSVQEVTATINGQTGALQPFMGVEHGPLMSNGAYAPFLPVRYRIQGGNIEFRPATQSFSSTVYYTPAPPRLVNPSDTTDGFAGYEMVAVYGACATVARKEESDPAFFLEEKGKRVALVEKMAAVRDMSNPERVQDVRDTAAWWPGIGGGWWP